MPTFRSVRLTLSFAVACLALLVGVASASAASPGYGELLRFNGVGTGAAKGHKFELEEETHAFGVDPTDNSVYVGDEKSGSSEEEFRIQKYSAAGAFQAAVLIKPGGNHTPEGMQYTEDLDGVAIDPVKKRIYVLVTYKRSGADSVDPSTEVAGAVYAFSTTPSGEELVPAEGANEKGLLASTTALNANSETQGQALLNPSGITVDPATHEVMILGEVDQGAGGFHAALARLSEKGVLGTTYVAPEALGANKPPDSPVVSQKGTVFFENADEILQIPSDFKSAPKVLFHFEEPESLIEGPFKDEIALFGEDTDESSYGGGLAIYPEGGAETEGRIVADSEVHEIGEGGTVGSQNTSVMAFHYAEAGGAVKVTETGWLGGKAGELGTAKSCVIGFALNYPQVAGAGEGRMFALTPSTSEVIEFGALKEGEKTTCPTAKAGGLEALILGKKVSTVTTSSNVTLSSKVTQANVLSVEWKFGDGSSNETVNVTPGEQIQTAEVQHKFAKVGKATVEAVIHTDNLATPVTTVTTTLNVEPPTGGPKVTTQPAGQTVVEGQDATFKSTASGVEPITIQWEESTNGGATWTKVGAGTSGGTTSTLTVSSVTTSESGRQYRATFTNSVEPEPNVHSSSATLTVETKAEHEAKEKAEQEAKEKAEREAKEKAEREAKEKAERERAEQEARERAAAQAAQEAVEVAARAAAAAKKAAEEALGKPPPPAEGAASVKVAGTSVTVTSAGAVSVKLSCPAGVSACTGTITLKTVGAVNASAGARQAKRAVLTLASGSFRLPGGQTETATLHLSAKAKTLLARSHTLGARATIVAHNAAGASVTTLAVLSLHAAKGHH
jgi:hypothetical protein